MQRAPLTVSVAQDETEAAIGATTPGATAPGATAQTGAPLAGSGVSAGEAPVTVHRSAAASEASTALEARSFTRAGEIYLPASHGPLSSGPAGSLLAHELTHVGQQRRLGSNLPPEQSPQGRTLEAEAVAAERSTTLPLAGPVGRRAADQGGGPSFTSEAVPPTAQRAVAVGHTTSPTLFDEGATVQLPGRLAAGVQRAKPGSGEASRARATAGAKRRLSEQELEDLARQLSARIGRRLRREALVDRERAGLAMDLP